MPKKPNIDMARIKEFFLQKGERVGLGAAAGLALLLLVLGFLGITTRPPASANSPTWDTAFSKAAEEMKRKMDPSFSKPPPTPDESKTVVVSLKDAIARASDFPPFIPFPIEVDDKRRNPPILPVAAQVPGEVQVDYLRAPALTYEVNFDTNKIWVLNGEPVKYLEPQKMALVTTTFPYREQMELYRQLLRYTSMQEMLAKKDGPQFLGLNIIREELVPPGQKQPDYVPLYMYNKESDKTEVAPNLDRFFRKMVIDTTNPAQYGPLLGPNLVTPVPFLAAVTPGASEKYPKLKIPGLGAEEGSEDDPAAPKVMKAPGLAPGFRTQPQPQVGKGGDKTQERNPVLVSWSKLPDQELAARLSGKYNVFDPLGRAEAKAGEGNANNTSNNNLNPRLRLQMPGVPGLQDKNPRVDLRGNAADDNQLPKLMVRFIDMDLQVGKTYRYWIQVRVANPNYGNKDVSDTRLAADKELYSQAVFTPTITPGEEMFYYAIDQSPVHSAKMRGGIDVTGQPNDQVTPVQIERWISKFEDSAGQTHRIGDWAVAERLLVRRGEPLGRHEVLVEAPEWDHRQGKFILGGVTNKKKDQHYIPVDFILEDRPVPLLVDFQGGRHDKYRPKKTASGIGLKDDAETELLILDSDGKLILRKSRDDSLDSDRLKHYQRWWDRVKTLREASSGGAGPGGAPGIRGGPGTGGGPGIR